MLRPEPRRASTGSVRVANQAGAAPKTIPVKRATTNANSNTLGDGRGLMGRKCELRNAKTRSKRAAATATRRPATPPATASRILSHSACITICRLAGAESDPEGGLRPARNGACQQQICHVRTRNQQNHGANGQQDLETTAILFLHLRDTGARGNHIDHLLRNNR